MKAFKIVVLAKQVPDTRKAGKDAMKADGTINRSILPAIFNPEDLHALEQALRVKDQFPNSEITVLTMGPPRAVEIIKEGFYRGADHGILLTDRAFAGSDTLATSYALAATIKAINDVDIIFAGRQAIDGDTAQVGPQVAEKLGVPQITYAEEIINITNKKIQVKRRLENGVEILECPFPLVITVNNTAPICRPRNAKRLMKYKHAATMSNRQDTNEDYLATAIDSDHLIIEEWGVNDIDVDQQYLGLSGSPTKVKKVNHIAFQSVETKSFLDTDEDMDQLMQELVENHIIG